MQEDIILATIADGTIHAWQPAALAEALVALGSPRVDAEA